MPLPYGYICNAVVVWGKIRVVCYFFLSEVRVFVGEELGAFVLPFSFCRSVEGKVEDLVRGYVRRNVTVQRLRDSLCIC
jgi:hypothetical protein